MSDLRMQTNVVYVENKKAKAEQQQKKIVPKEEPKKIVPKAVSTKTKNSFTFPMNKVLNVVSGGSITSLAKAVPYVAIAMAVVKTVDKFTSTYLDFQSGYSGNYTASLNYSNFKAAIGAITSPVSAIINWQKSVMEANLDHERKEQERILLGANTRGV